MIVGLLSMPIAQTAVAKESAQKTVNILLDGSYLECDIAPIVEQGEILVPLRSIGKALDVGIYWDAQTKTATLQTSDWRAKVELKFKIGSNTAEINGRKVALAVPAQLTDGRILVPAEIIGENLDLAVEWDEKVQTLSFQERYRSRNGNTEVILTPTKPDKDSSYMIYHGMQVEIGGVKYEYDWDWNASTWKYLTYASPEIVWADLNGDGEEEIIIRLVDGIYRGTGVSFEDVHVLEQNGKEIAVQDAREYALSLAQEKDKTFVGDWTRYEVIDGELTAKVTVYENDEWKAWQMKYDFVNGKLQVVQIASVKN